MGDERRLERRARNAGGLAFSGVSFAEQVILEWQNTIIVSRATPEHRSGRHDAAFSSLNCAHMASAAGFFHDSIIRWINEPNKLGALSIQERVARLWVSRRGVVPAVYELR